MMNRFYLVEGETEQAFFECLKESRFIAPGKIRKYNLMRKAVTPGEYFLSFRNPELICVIDTDVITDSTPDCLAQNLKTLLRVAGSPKKVKLLVQNQNFEDELCRILQCPKSSLPGRVDSKLKTLKDCKQKLANMRPEDYRRLLKGDPLRRIPTVYCAKVPDVIQEILERNNLSTLLADPTKIFHIP